MEIKASLLEWLLEIQVPEEDLPLTSYVLPLTSYLLPLTSEELYAHSAILVTQEGDARLRGRAR